MECPKCLGRLKCMETRIGDTSTELKRIRECEECDCKVETKEVIVRYFKKKHKKLRLGLSKGG